MEEQQTFNIIRVEHEDGWGMFRFNEATGYRYTIGDTKETAAMYNLHYSRPRPHEDGIKFIAGEDYCAFDSLETFSSLVKPRSINFLFKHGFKVVMLTVTAIKRGGHQVAYRKEDVIEVKDISSLFAYKNRKQKTQAI